MVLHTIFSSDYFDMLPRTNTNTEDHRNQDPSRTQKPISSSILLKRIPTLKDSLYTILVYKWSLYFGTE